MMTGWKTWAAGGVSILSGIVLILKALIGEGAEGGIMEGISLIIAGLAILGIGHKIEKSNPK
jgi:hypothetical protein